MPPRPQYPHPERTRPEMLKTTNEKEGGAKTTHPVCCSFMETHFNQYKAEVTQTAGIQIELQDHIILKSSPFDSEKKFQP